jgi:hypothetical protein
MLKWINAQSMCVVGHQMETFTKRDCLRALSPARLNYSIGKGSQTVSELHVSSMPSIKPSIVSSSRLARAANVCRGQVLNGWTA